MNWAMLSSVQLPKNTRIILANFQKLKKKVLIQTNWKTKLRMCKAFSSKLLGKYATFNF